MTKELNHRELFVYENQDRLALKEMGKELHLDINNVAKMLRRANKFFGRTARKKRANRIKALI